MKKIFLIALAAMLATASFAQSGDIVMVKGGKFTSDDQVLKPKEVLNLMQSKPQAYAAFKKAKSNYDAAMAFGYVGGFLIGWPVGTALGGGEPQWALAGAGAAIVLLSIPLNSGFKKNAKKALEIYNDKTVARGRFRPTLNLNVQPTGAKLTLQL